MTRIEKLFAENGFKTGERIVFASDEELITNATDILTKVKDSTRGEPLHAVS